jgi:hypothetical protein
VACLKKEYKQLLGAKKEKKKKQKKNETLKQKKNQPETTSFSVSFQNKYIKYE